MVAAEGNRGENVFFIARNDDADRNLVVIGAVGCVEGPAARVEADLSAKVAAESGFKRGGVELRGMGRRWGDILRHRVQNIFEDAGAVRKGRKESAHEGCVAQARRPRHTRTDAGRSRGESFSHWRRKAGSVYNFYAFEVKSRLTCPDSRNSTVKFS